MSKLTLTVVLVAATAVGLGGCQRQKRADVVIGGHRLEVGERLVCPEHQGRLDRVSQSSDGQACGYSGPDGSEITLSRLPVSGRSPSDALKDVQRDLASLVPTPPTLGQMGKSPDGGETAKDTVHVEGTDGHDSPDHARIDLPGLHIHTDGDNASVKLPGVTINAQGDNAHISTGIGELKNATIDAADGAVRITSDMTDAGNVDETWVVATDAPGAAGWRSVGYVARGPVSGPLVVARMRSRTEHHHDHAGGWELDDVRRLVGLSLK